MIRTQARLLVLVLAAKRIPFQIKRQGSLYSIAFPQADVMAVQRAIGA